jgi:predicted nucleic acid-binding protein
VIVLDASALVELLLNTSRGQAVAALVEDPGISLHIPHLADLEVTQALRRYAQDGELDDDEAEAALEELSALDLQRHAHEPLLSRIWELRKNLTAYDAAYVALAEALNARLLTCDSRLARAPGMSKRVEVI